MALVEKLECIGSILQVLRERPGFAKVAAREGDRALHLVKEAAGENWAAVLDVVRKIGLKAESEEAILDVIAEKMVTDEPPATSTKASRTSTQNYESFLSFVPAAIWSTVREGKVDPLYDHLGLLGLRNPSEPTSVGIALAILHQTDGYEKAFAMTPETRHEFVKTTKHTFRHRGKGWLKPQQYIAMLPGTLAEMKVTWPRVYETAFAKVDPSESPVPVLELSMLKANTPMRKTSSSSQRQVPSLQLQPVVPQQEFFQRMFMQMIGLCMPERQIPTITVNRKPLMLEGCALPTSPPPAGQRPAPDAPASGSGVEVLQGAILDAPASGSGAEAERGAKAMSIDAIAAEINKELDSRSSSKKKAKQAKEVDSRSSKKVAKKAKKKAKAKPTTQPPLTKAKGENSKSTATFTTPLVPKLKKMPPVKLGTCTIYTDVARSQWRAIEASNRRRDVKFNWKDGAATAESWKACVQWCRDNTK